MNSTDRKRNAEAIEVIDQALSSGNCALFFGPGMSSHFGLANRFELVEHLLRNAKLAEGTLVPLQNMMNERQVEAVAEVLSAQLGMDTVHRLLGSLLSKPKRKMRKSWNLMAKLPFSSVITTNYDSLVEEMFADRDPLVLSGGLDEDTAAGFNPSRFVIAKVYGDINKPSSVRFTTDQYRADMLRNESLTKIVSSILSTKTVLFMGMSVSGILDFYSAFAASYNPSQRRHYALVPDSSFAKVQQDRFRLRYGIELMFYGKSDDFAEVDSFVRDLASRSPAYSINRVGPPVLESVRLSNIGPFAEVELSLTGGWNVVLGNNASGKSSLLKAIALGLCGDDPQITTLAGRLLRVGQKQATIELVISGTTFRTELILDGDRTRVISSQVSPLQSQAWLVLGFPALRSIAGTTPKSYTPTDRMRSLAADVTPLIIGLPDTRIEDIKSWIIYNEMTSAVLNPLAAVSSDSTGLTSSLNRHFFEIIADLLPGNLVGFASVDSSRWDVYVDTVDGSVSLDQISQGMTSLLGWIGTFLQRMYEVHIQSATPAQEPALLLIDEIDAHLHPEWQKALIPLLKKHFPKLQVVATSHSPLVVSELSSEEILVSSRGTGNEPTISPSSLNPTGMRSDQLLTSSLFGLATTRSSKVGETVAEYAGLLGLTSPNEQQQHALSNLRKDIQRWLLAEETEVGRIVEAGIEAATKVLGEPAVMYAGTSAVKAVTLRGQLSGLLDNLSSVKESES